MKQAIFFCDQPHNIRAVYAIPARNILRQSYCLPDTVYSYQDLLQTDFSKVEAVFSTWGMPSLTPDEIRKYFPSLKYLFYAAGTVQSFARPFLQNGVRVFSAWQANAIPVAELAVAQILLANKGYFQLTRKTPRGYGQATKEFRQFIGNYGAKIGILGDGAIGSLVIDELLRHDLEVLVYSITMTPEQAVQKGVRLSGLSQIFSECDVISNHLANNDATQKIINAPLLQSMKPHATLINTGRGAQIDEEALIDLLTARPDITALLDVTFPEPPLPDSPLNQLENVFLTPHIAGSAGHEVQRMGAFMAEACAKILKGLPSQHEVTEKMLEVMA